MSLFEKRAGELVWYYGVLAPWGTLPCDGGEYLKTDYPALWAVLATETFEITHTKVFEVDSTHFAVPDLVGRVLVGYLLTDESQDVTEGWGEETHALTIGEMPQHYHQYYKMIDGAQQYNGGSNRARPITELDYTTSAGSDIAHNNMQPSMRARIAIRYT
jgi:microcystin-dependent protein